MLGWCKHSSQVQAFVALDLLHQGPADCSLLLPEEERLCWANKVCVQLSAASPQPLLMVRKFL